MNTGKVVRYKNTDVPRQSGEVGRIRILKGPDQGAIFVIKDSSVVIGRGEEVDLRIRDLKSSRSHARLDYTKEGWVMSDLGSANGIFFQGEYIRKFALTSEEHFTIGETICEFLVSHESTQMLIAPLRNAEEVSRQDEALSRQKVRVQNLGKTVQASTGAADKKKSNPRTLLLLAACAGIYLYMDSSSSPSKPAATAKKADVAGGEADRSLASYLPSGVTKDIEKTADQYYWQGFREYTKGNYLRAKEDFGLALQVDPSNERARHYLMSSDKENNDEIKRLIASGNKAKLIGHNAAAKGYYETAMRHMYNDRANPDYIECEEALKALDKDSSGGGV